jgi:hypothetical protein
MQSIQFTKQRGPNSVAKIIALAIGSAAFIVVFGFAFGWLIQFLWNATVATIFNVSTISYWQAIGLFFLAKFFFGFGRGDGHKKREPKNTDERWKKWWSAKSNEKSEPGDDESLKRYWQEEGKAAYETFLVAQEANRKTTRDDSGTPPT